MDALDNARKSIENNRRLNKENEKLNVFIGDSFNKARAKLSREENEKVEKALEQQSTEMGKLYGIDPNKILDIAKKWRS